jgi:hypothetical protein
MRKILILISTLALSLSGLTFNPVLADVVTVTVNCDEGTFDIVGTQVENGSTCEGEAIIPARVESIGTDAFNGAELLTKVTFAQGSMLTLIDFRAFRNTRLLTTMTLPQSLESVGAFAFDRTGIRSMSIPANVEFIGPYAFAYSDIVQLDVVGANESFSSQNNVLFNKDKTRLIAYLGEPTNEYVVPNSVTAISLNAFAERLIQNVTLSPNLIEIGAYAFAGTPITKISIPESMTYIDILTFGNTDSLTSITIPASVTDIDFEAFIGSPTPKNLYFLGDAPNVIAGPEFDLAIGSKAYARVGAENFEPFGETWKGLTMAKGRMVSFSGNGSLSGSVPSLMLVGVGENIGAPGNSGGLVNSGYSFSGWNTAANGSGTTYTLGSTGQMPDFDLPLYAKWTIAPVVDTAAQLAAADLAARTVGVKKSFVAKSLAAKVGIKTISPKAKVTFSIAKSSKKVCSKSGSKIKTLSVGNCVVTFTVQEPKPKKGKKPKATKTVKTLVVQ